MKSMKPSKLIPMEHKPSVGDNMPSIAEAVTGDASGGPSTKEPSYPGAYLSHPDLPKMKVGDKVKLHGVVKAFTTRDTKEGAGADNSADIDIHHVEPIGAADEEGQPNKKHRGSNDDENAIETGLAAAENNND